MKFIFSPQNRLNLCKLVYNSTDNNDLMKNELLINKIRINKLTPIYRRWTETFSYRFNSISTTIPIDSVNRD